MCGGGGGGGGGGGWNVLATIPPVSLRVGTPEKQWGLCDAPPPPLAFFTVPLIHSKIGMVSRVHVLLYYGPFILFKLSPSIVTFFPNVIGCIHIVMFHMILITRVKLNCSRSLAENT